MQSLGSLENDQTHKVYIKQSMARDGTETPMELPGNWSGAPRMNLLEVSTHTGIGFAGMTAFESPVVL